MFALAFVCLLTRQESQGNRAMLSLSQIISSIVTLIPSGLPSWTLTCTELKGTGFVCFSFWLRVLD